MICKISHCYLDGVHCYKDFKNKKDKRKLNNPLITSDEPATKSNKKPKPCQKRGIFTALPQCLLTTTAEIIMAPLTFCPRNLSVSRSKEKKEGPLCTDLRTQPNLHSTKTMNIKLSFSCLGVFCAFAFYKISCTHKIQAEDFLFFLFFCYQKKLQEQISAAAKEKKAQKIPAARCFSSSSQ